MSETTNAMNSKPSRKGLVRRVCDFYVEGFRSMTIGRKLWALIIVKLAILFLVLKLFFFPDVLAEQYDTDAERADAVRNNLTIKK